MKKIIVMLGLLILLSACAVQELPKPQKYQEMQLPKPAEAPKGDYIILKFAHEECSLDGDFLFNNNSLGSFKGSFKFNLDDFNSFRQSSNRFCVNGNLKGCEYEGWFIDTNCWEYSGNESYFTGEEAELQITFDPRGHAMYAMSNFVRPQDVKWYVDSISLEGDMDDNMDKIHRRMSSKSYILDYSSSKSLDYWMFPNETLGKKQCDCEDWSTTMLSLFKAYDPSLKCYNLVVPGHITTMCKIGNEYTIYDQKESKYSTSVDPKQDWNTKRLRIRGWMEDYFETYGFYPKYRYVVAAFDDKSFVQFAEMDDFVKWALEL